MAWPGILRSCSVLVLLAVLAACNAQTSQSPQRVQVPAGQLNPIPPGAPPLATVPLVRSATSTGTLPQTQPPQQAGLRPRAPSPASGQSRFQPIPQNSLPRQAPAPVPQAEREEELSEFSLDRKLAQQGLRGEETSLRDNRFAAPPPPPVSSNIPRVAILLPLTGEHAKLGQAMLNAAQLALFHFADKSFELLPHDTRGTPQGAADAASLAIGDGAALILGPLFSSSVEAVKPATEAAGLSVISFSNDQRVSGGNVFTMGFRPEEHISQVVRYAFGKGLRRFALLAPDNSYGQTVGEALGNMVSQLGAEIADTAFYDPHANDFEPLIRWLADYDVRRQNLLDQRKDLEARDDEVAEQALKRLENLQTLGDVPFDALLIADGGKRLQAVAALLPYYDIDPKKTRMLGTGQWDAPGIGAEPALVGGWFAAPSALARRTFVTQYQEIYGATPPRLVTLAYDATALAAVFVKSDGQFDPAEITAAQGFSGRDGIFRFTPYGFAQRGLAIHEVRTRSNREIRKAPTSFENVIN